MDRQNSFFTLQSLSTLSGASVATYFISNGIQQALNVNPAWLALLVAEVICIGMVWLNAGEGVHKGKALFVAVINGFLVFSTASGLTNVTAATVSKPPVDEAPAAARSFTTPWL